MPRRERFSLRNKPWLFRATVGVLAGLVFDAMFALAWGAPMSYARSSAISAGVFLGLTAFSGFPRRMAQFASEAVIDKLFGWRRDVDPTVVERNDLLSRIARFDRAGDGRRANRLRIELLDKGLAPNPAAVCFQIGNDFENVVQSPREALRWYRRCCAYGANDNVHYHEAQHRAELLKEAGHADDADQYEREEAVAAAIRAGDDARAEEAIEELARLHPHDDAPYFFRGLLASHREAHALAAGHYREALALNPGNEKAAYNLAVALTKAGDIVAAREAWSEFLAKHPTAGAEYVQAARAALAEIEELSRTELESTGE